MPFSLTDLKRSYGRSGVRGGAPDVRPFLFAGETLPAFRPRIERLIAWHEAHLGWRRGDIDWDEPARIMGDYRVARCLLNCLQRYYRFAPKSFEAAVLQEMDGQGRRSWSRLQECGAGSASALRLYVFDRVARTEAGFAAPAARGELLAAIAGALGLSASGLDRLLWLDAEEEERLGRTPASADESDETGALAEACHMPRVETVAALYNRRALETILVRALSADRLLPAPDGDAIRRTYFLVKRNGLLAELSLADPRRGARGGVRLHLFGPLEVFGPRTRHGDRFARLLLQLLRSEPGLRGSARVLLNEREYELRLDAETVMAIHAAPDEPPASGAAAVEEDSPTAIVTRPDVDVKFDSDIEARLFATLRGMERRGDTAGWHVEREPEPVLHEDIVFVPDFLMTCGAGAGETRVYVEVIGFWSPAYRQRKRDKLRRLAGQVPLVLAVQEQIAGEFADLPFPLLRYRQRISAVELVRLLRREFGGPATSPAALRAQLEAILRELPSRAILRETIVRSQLQVTAEELAEAFRPSAGREVVARADDRGGREPCHPPAGGQHAALDDWRWIPGLGACLVRWLGQVSATVGTMVATSNGPATDLEAVRQAVQQSALDEADAAAAHLELLLPALGYEIVWQSLFEATVSLGTAAPSA